MPLPFMVPRVKTGPAVNGLATGNSAMLTLDNNGQRFIPTSFNLEVVSITGTLVTAPSVSVGTTAGGSEILGPTTPTLGLLSALNKLAKLDSVINGVSVPSGSTIYFTINTAATGPSVFSVRPDLTGYYST